MAYRFLPDEATADLAFLASGSTVGAVFAAAVEATIHAMVENPADIRPQRRVEVHLEGVDLDLLLFDLLGEVIFHKDAELLLLRPETVAVHHGRLDAVLRGERLDPDRHEQRVDVKAVTLHDFWVAGDDTAGWEAHVVLDI